MPACLIDFVRPVAALQASDDLGKARHALCLTNLGALPVVADGRVVGILSERDLSLAICPQDWQQEKGGEGTPSGQEVSGADNGNGPRLASCNPPGSGGEAGGSSGRVHVVWTNPCNVAEAMRAGSNFVVSGATTLSAACQLVVELDLPFLAVSKPDGVLIGAVSRSDLLGALVGDLRPTRVGGLATPLGIHLTTGDLRAGVGDLGLMLAGAQIMTLLGLTIYGLGLFETVVLQLPPYDSDLGLVLSMLVFLLLLRQTPIARIHAAEHQVVHAIEKGESLRLERVKIQPKEHPRCGTNLAAVAIFAQLALPHVSAAGALLTLLAVALLLTWRKLGWAMQRFFTTRTATESDLKSAISTAAALLSLHNAKPEYRAPRWRRIWNSGMPQILIGALVVYWAFVATQMLIVSVGNSGSI